MNSHLRSNRIKTRSPQSEFQLSIETQCSKEKGREKESGWEVLCTLSKAPHETFNMGKHHYEERYLSATVKP